MKMTKERSRLLVTISLIFWVGLLVYLSGVPYLFIWTQGWLLRKLGHSVMYGILTLLIWINFSYFTQRRFIRVLSCLCFVLLCSLYDEIHQIFVPGRCGNIKGLFFDLIGMVFMLVAIHLSYWSSAKKTSAFNG